MPKYRVTIQEAIVQEHQNIEVDAANKAEAVEKAKLIIDFPDVHNVKLDPQISSTLFFAPMIELYKQNNRKN